MTREEVLELLKELVYASCGEVGIDSYPVIDAAQFITAIDRRLGDINIVESEQE